MNRVAPLKLAAVVIMLVIIYYMSRQLALTRLYPLSLASFFNYALIISVTPMAIALISAALTLITRSPCAGVAASLIPVTLASSSYSLLFLGATSITSTVIVVIIYLIVTFRRSPRELGGRPLSMQRRAYPSPLPLSTASLGLALQATLNVVLSGSNLYAEIVYVSASLISAVVASLYVNSGRAKEVLYGAASSLGPFGLAVVTAMLTILGP